MKRILLRGLIIVLVLVIVLAVALVIVLRTSWGRQQVASLAAQQASRFVNGDVAIGRIEGNLFRSPSLHDVVIGREGDAVVSIDRIDVEYDAAAALGGQLAIDRITLTRPVVRLEPGERGLSILDVIQPEDGRQQGPARAFAISPIVIIDGRVVIDPRVETLEWVEAPAELTDLDASLGLMRTTDTVRLDIETLSFTAVSPRLVVEQFTGDLVFGDGDVILENVLLTTDGSQLTVHASLRDLLARPRSE